MNAELQGRVQRLLKARIAQGHEQGLQVAAYHRGKLVLDAWAGTADARTGRPVDAETLFLSFSCSKGVTHTLIHQLVEAGKLDYDAPLADLWPEFGVRGKAQISLRQLLTHSAGLPQLSQRIDFATLGRPQAMNARMVNLKPLWRPGQRSGYHAITQGIILAEIAKRATGQPFARLVQEQIALPLGIPDFFFGLPEAERARLAWIDGAPPPWVPLRPRRLIHRAIPATLDPGPKWNVPAATRAVLPASNLVTSARSLARHYAALCPGGVDGVVLLPPQRLRQATARQTGQPDVVLFGRLVNKALGYRLGSVDTALGPRLSVFGHPGAGGSVAFADPEQQFSFALLKNRMSWLGPDDTDVQVARLVRETLGLS
ncbi:MAG: serine hydrolase domain-containing protein [Candidatus Sericytochromatia bacterium]